MWFRSLTGFDETDPDQVRENISVDGVRMTSRVNGREMTCGRLEMPSLSELRRRLRGVSLPAGRLRLSEVVDDVQRLHRQPENAGALFQVASQFNLLEMVSPSITPEEGVGIYERDRTQGPACAIACGAGTIFRNYFVPVDGHLGQSHDNQVDCLRDLGEAFGNDDARLWQMRNGYALASEDGLQQITRRLVESDERGLDALRGKLRIGIHHDTEVTIAEPGHTVCQAFCSAVPVAYSPHSADYWSAFARLILEASYEATFWAAAENLQRGGSDRLFLTLLGGGAFGNRIEWIIDAIARAATLLAAIPLKVSIVSHGSPRFEVRELIQSFASA